MINFKNSSIRISRKEFFIKLSGVLLIPLAFLWNNSVIKKLIADKKVSEIRISKAAIQEGISFIDEIIAVKNGTELKFFSAVCTHLGCKLNKFEGSEFICQCHVSRFSVYGKVISGPATQPLKELSFEFDLRSNEIIISNGQ